MNKYSDILKYPTIEIRKKFKNKINKSSGSK